ncbi:MULTISPECIES: GntR family transcriptional regulator [Exiguobacterium]|uniref:GntR family transcriptional regulator n=1 Tax=Exiguobacterium TaxID=33986 RepID=UPI001BECA1AD|nr:MULTISPECIES: GntR family transcriptional regulator [Exiguobacterium]MCT4791043.1 GntR family transcriptional regulator [Exiguobacterium artemiae]
MLLHFNKRIPIYLQVLDWFKKRIVMGEFKRGESIPSRRALAATLKIHPNTAQKVYKELEEQQLITTELNVPSKVTMDQSVIDQARTELLDNTVTQFVESIRALQISLEEGLINFEKEYTIRKGSELDA